MQSIMKKLILIAAFMLAGFKAKAQEYRSMEQFGLDTIAYLQYNFIDRRDQYIGQKLEKLVYDYELFWHMSTIATYPFAPGANGESYVLGISVAYLYGIEMQAYRKKGIPYAYLHIYFFPPYMDNDVARELMPDPDDDRAWALRMGDLIIERIELMEENTDKN